MPNGSCPQGRKLQHLQGGSCCPIPDGRHKRAWSTTWQQQAPFSPSSAAASRGFNETWRNRWRRLLPEALLCLCKAMAEAKFRIPDRCCLVTGGTKGIGKAVVEELCGLGAKVFTCARTEQDLTEALQSWKSSGLDVQGCVADVSDDKSRRNLMEQVTSAFDGKLDILINNVGSNIRKTTLEYTHEDFDSIMSTNMKSAFCLAQLCYPQLKMSGYPSIVFLSSAVASGRATGSGIIYSMTKGAMNQVTKNLACEWAKDGIRVNAVSPWYIETPLTHQVLAKPGYTEKICESTPMGRIGEVSEVSGAVAFLCSQAASYITGQILTVDGGYSVMGCFY